MKAMASTLPKGFDGSVDLSLSCWYCRDTGHELKNCRQFQMTLAWKSLATQGTVAQEMTNATVLNVKGPMGQNLIGGEESDSSEFSNLIYMKVGNGY